MLKKILLALLVVLLVLQVFRPEKNTTGNKENDISTLYAVPANVDQILVKACKDCHSNNTVYPWYAEVQPIAWFLDDHVRDGKKHLNFNEFATYRLAKQFHKLEEVYDEVKGGEMPLESYTVVHRDAKLTEEERSILMDWSVAVRDSMKARFPADSLILKKTK